MALAEDLLDDTVDRFTGPEIDVEEWDLAALPAGGHARLRRSTPGRLRRASTSSGLNSGEIGDALWERDQGTTTRRRKQLVGRDLLRRVERDIMLQIVDAQWKDHLYSLDHLKEGIGLRGYGQRDPLVEYKKESFELFQAMKDAHRRGDRPVPVAAAPVLNDGERRRPEAPARAPAAPCAGAAPQPAAHPQQPRRAGGRIRGRARARPPRRRARSRPSRRAPAATTRR